jgi:hypothetical protein
LPLKQFSQQLHGLNVSAQRQAQVRRQLPDNVIFVIVFEDQQVFFEGFSGLAFLQELLRALNALADLGSV